MMIGNLTPVLQLKRSLSIDYPHFYEMDDRIDTKIFNNSNIENDINEDKIEPTRTAQLMVPVFPSIYAC
jgi:hypothetical protein